MNKTFIFYNFRRCPYAMRARMALKISGANPEHREMLLKDKPKAMLKVSPKGTVPVLVLKDGTVLEESLDIMHWTLTNRDPLLWLQDKAAPYIYQADQDFKPLLDRYKYPQRYDEKSGKAFREQALLILKEWNDALTKNNGFLLPNGQSIADIALFPFVRQFAFVDKKWFYSLPLPAIQQWLNSHIDSRLFQSIMPKVDLWVEEANPTPVFFQDVMQH